MEKQKYKYDAFISYRHTELDKYIAEKIHKYLEEFKLPKNLINKNGIKKIRIERVFRDKEELTISNNLEDPIIMALKDSEFLIVICSPRIKESIWCRKEIEKFIEFHGRNKVLTVLIEGEPEESFPEELLFEDEISIENGIESIHRKEVEPLAADIRGKSKKQMCKLLKAELLRVIAPMFGIEYDDLRQRHRERKKKKMFTAIILAATIGIAIGFAGIASTSVINNQKEQIESQNKKSLYSQAENLANEALQYFEQDRIDDALKSAYYSVTEYDGIKMPYTANGEYALTQALRLYDVGGIYKANKQFVSTATIENIELSSSKKYVMSYDNATGLNMWDVTSGNILMQIEDVYADDVLNVWAEFAGDSKIVYLDNSGKVRVVDFVEKKEMFTIDVGDYVLSVKGDEAGKNIVVSWEDKIEVYDATNGEIIHQVQINSESILDSEVVCFDGKLFYLEEEESKSTIKIADINSKDLYEFVGNFNRIVEVKRTDEQIYVLAENLDISLEGIYSTIIAIDNECNLEWQSEFEDTSFIEIDILEGEGEQVAFAVSDSKIVGFDSKTGGEIFEERISEGIRDIAVGSEGIIQIITSEGRIMAYYPFFRRNVWYGLLI